MAPHHPQWRVVPSADFGIGVGVFGFVAVNAVGGGLQDLGSKVKYVVPEAEITRGTDVMVGGRGFA